jgi:hypothetical protein
MQQQKLIWLAIFFSTIVYAGMAYMIGSAPPQPFEQSVRDPVTLIMYLAALSAFAAGFFVPRLLQRAPAQTRAIMSLAIFEACAIFGLVATFITRDWRVYLPAWALAVIGFLRAWPSSDVSDVPGSSRTPL